MRKKILAANWKMNHTTGEAESYVETFKREMENENRVEMVLIPSATALHRVSDLLKNVQYVRLGAQNLHWEKTGAFTGEISGLQLRELLVRYVVVGHSERRTLFGETDSVVNRKVRAALENGLRPILCIGETLEERDSSQVETVLARQLEAALGGLDTDALEGLVIAYEPVWAIGSGRTATPDQAQNAHAFIRERLSGLVGADVASKTRIQYGGSVKPSNTAELMIQPDIDGALVGGASLDPRQFAEIIRATVGR
jgi:triosephosphate isomerase